MHGQVVQPDALSGERSVVRLGVVQGDYHWHKHDEDDEFFYVVRGRFLIDLEGRTIELRPGRGSWSRKASCSPHAGARADGDPDGRDRGDRADGKLIPNHVIVGLWRAQTERAAESANGPARKPDGVGDCGSREVRG